MQQQQQVAISTMLRNLNGKYSAYDIANYVFWSGDEAGVASAVEELIDEGLMSRENAIEFLNDIRLGIDYLENTYSIKQNESKSVRMLINSLMNERAIYNENLSIHADALHTAAAAENNVNNDECK